MSPNKIIIDIKSINNNIFISGIYPQNIIKIIYNDNEYDDKFLILQDYTEELGNFIIISNKIKIIYDGDIKFVYITSSDNYEIKNDWKKVKVYNNYINIYEDLTTDSIPIDKEEIIKYNNMNINRKYKVTLTPKLIIYAIKYYIDELIYIDKLRGGNGKIKSKIKTIFFIIKDWINRKIKNNSNDIKSDINNKNLYIIKYTYKGEKYEFPLLIRRGPKSILEYAIDDKGRDITKQLKKYQGPNKDFHGLQLTPKILGYKGITLISDGIEKIIEENQKINL